MRSNEARVDTSRKPLDRSGDGEQALPLRQQSQGFADERTRYLDFLKEAEATGPWPKELTVKKHSIPWPVDMADPRAHITCHFSEENFSKPTPRERHRAVDVQLPRGTPVRPPERCGLVCCFPDRLRNGLSDVFLYSAHSKILYTLAHLDTKSIPQGIRKVDYWDLWHSNQRSLSAQSQLGVVGTFLDKKRLSEDVAIAPDVEAAYGRSYDHVHIAAHYLPSSDEMTNLLTVGRLPQINPLLLFKKLYE